MAYYPCESKHKKYKLRIDWNGSYWGGSSEVYINKYTVYIIDTATNVITFSEGDLRTGIWYAPDNIAGNQASITGVSLTEID